MRTAGVPKYEQIKRALIVAIGSGRWKADEPFPSEAELLEQFDVSRPTLVRSLQELVAEGYLVRKQGKGTFVSARLPAGAAAPTPQTATAVTVFISRDAAGLTGAGREVQLRILRGVQEVMGDSYHSSILHQAAPKVIDVQTRRFLESAEPGVALMIEPGFNPALRLLLIERGWNVWSINEPTDDGNCVFIDQRRAGYLATRYLLDAGRKHVALLNGPSEAYWGFTARREGYCAALRDAGMAVDERLIRQGAHVIDSEAGRSMMHELLDAGLAVDAVVGASDSKAIGAMAVVVERKLAVPEQVMFASIDNIIAQQAPMPLTAVAMPFEEMGFQAAAHALAGSGRRWGNAAIHTRISLEPVLIER
jgi:DNA-binding LacI/PurR family transcriptional regulator